FGLLTLVFQNTWAEALLDFESTGHIVNWVPLFLFVVLFGLSMDYHVFVVSRIQEAAATGAGHPGRGAGGPDPGGRRDHQRGRGDDRGVRGLRHPQPDRAEAARGGARGGGRDRRHGGANRAATCGHEPVGAGELVAVPAGALKCPAGVAGADPRPGGADSRGRSGLDSASMKDAQEAPDTLLARIGGPEDLRALTPDALTRLAAEIRDFLVAKVSRTGGHLGPNLGVVELALALHRAFDSPRDSILFDTAHQAYVHNLVTERQGGPGLLRPRGGLSGYPTRAESELDRVGTSHASTALPCADGRAKADALRGERRHVVAVVGGGARTGGMCWEALNNIAHA